MPASSSQWWPCPKAPRLWIKAAPVHCSLLCGWGRAPPGRLLAAPRRVSGEGPRAVRGTDGCVLGSSVGGFAPTWWGMEAVHRDLLRAVSPTSTLGLPHGCLGSPHDRSRVLGVQGGSERQVYGLLFGVMSTMIYRLRQSQSSPRLKRRGHRPHHWMGGSVLMRDNL